MIPYEELAAALARHAGRPAPAEAPSAHDLTSHAAEPPPLDDATFNVPVEAAEEEIGDIVSEEELP